MSVSVRRALYGKMAGDGTLTGMLGSAAQGYTQSIYYGQAPAGAPHPHIIFQKSSGVPTEAFTDPSAFETDIWMIKAVDRASTADPVEAIQARLSALLNDASLSISGGSLMYLRRQSDVDYPELTDGVQYHHSGSLFRLVYQ